MTAFGLLWAVAGPSPLADPRVWFGVAFVAVFALALRVAQAKDVARWTVFVTATPIIAFELAVGGTDVPIIALICLGFAFMWQHPRPVLAGVLWRSRLDEGHRVARDRRGDQPGAGPGR